MNDSIRFFESKKRDLRGYTLIEGFPGMGLVGTIAAKYMVEKLEFELIGHIDSDFFIPLIQIHKGLPLHPSRIYANDDLKMVIFISEQVIPRQETYGMARASIDWYKEKGIGRVISLAGINTGNANDKKIYGIGSNPKTIKLLEENEIEVIQEGITTGITAIILLELDHENIDAFSIMGPVSIGTDYKASAGLLEKLSKILKLEINTAPLLKEAKQTESELLNQMQKLRESSDTMQKTEDHGPAMYT
ncbi:MAG: PAC2 family protein [Candidatus Micrarchaeota archaeon]